MYAYHPHYVDAVAFKLTSGTDYLYLHDANFNVTAVVDNSGQTSGNVAERYSYSPYGEVTFLAPDFSPLTSSQIGNEILYTGRERDTSTGLQLNRERWYHAQLGRWMNQDPIGYDGGSMNLYEYVASAPINYSDPMGLEQCGPRVWLYTGSWCVEDNVWDAAMDAAAGVVTCWWQCEVETHQTVCGRVLVATEVTTGTISVVGARIPKPPDMIRFPGDDLRSLFRELARRFGNRRAEQMIRAIAHNRPIMGAAKGGAAAAALVELGIAINCSFQCQ